MKEILQEMDNIWEAELKPAIETLENGGIILFPTDTIWGLGCDATNGEAVDKINQLKKRRPDKGHVLLGSDIQMVSGYVQEVPPKIQTLLDFHVRPLTVIYEGVKNLPSLSHAPDNTVAFRIPLDDMCKALINKLGKPVVATSANISESPFPQHFGEISSEILLQVDYIFKYKRTLKKLGQPSTIARLNRKNEVEVIRKG